VWEGSTPPGRILQSLLLTEAQKKGDNSSSKAVFFQLDFNTFNSARTPLKKRILISMGHFSWLNKGSIK